mgnify:CR=1 FL=1
MTERNQQVARIDYELDIDVTPDTVVTLVDGHKFLVTESVHEIIERIIAFRAAVLRAAQHPATSPSRVANVVSLARKDRNE